MAKKSLETDQNQKLKVHFGNEASQPVIRVGKPPIKK